MNADLIAQRLDKYCRTATPEKIVADFEALGVKFQSIKVPLILHRISDLEAMLEQDEKTEPLYFKVAHYLNIRRKQQRRLIELKEQYPVQFCRVNGNKKLYRVKIENNNVPL